MAYMPLPISTVVKSRHHFPISQPIISLIWCFTCEKSAFVLIVDADLLIEISIMAAIKKISQQ